MKSNKNIIWEFFASVKLALFTFFVLAATSIIGTVIPQNSSSAEYIQYYGQSAARLIAILDFNDMYRSWWFLALLVLFCLNLIVCSIERLPRVWKMVTLDNLAVEPERIRKMGLRASLFSSLDSDAVSGRVEELMAAAGWKASKGDVGGGTLFFSQKTPWVRLGVYVVHLSILIIFIGAIIGSVLGSKGAVYIPEGQSTDRIFETGTSREIPLGFEVRCDQFDIEYYDTRPKEYRSDLTVLENGKEVKKQRIVVNDPLDYRGWTFYQSSYDLRYQYTISIKDQISGLEKTFTVPPRQQVSWNEAGVVFGILGDEPPNNKWGSYSLKIWFSDNKGPASNFILGTNSSANVRRPGTTYLVSAQGFSRSARTGLQVAKDPGVWYVYAGCTLMLLGLIVTFFMSHRRMWVHVVKAEKGAEILVAGHSNKNKVGFEKDFELLVDALSSDEQVHISGKKS